MLVKFLKCPSLHDKLTDDAFKSAGIYRVRVNSKQLSTFPSLIDVNTACNDVSNIVYNFPVNAYSR